MQSILTGDKFILSIVWRDLIHSFSLLWESGRIGTTLHRRGHGENRDSRQWLPGSNRTSTAKRVLHRINLCHFMNQSEQAIWCMQSDE